MHSSGLARWETSARRLQGTVQGPEIDRRAGRKKWGQHFLYAAHSGHSGFLIEPYLTRGGWYKSSPIRHRWAHAPGASHIVFSAARTHVPAAVSGGDRVGDS